MIRRMQLGKIVGALFVGALFVGLIGVPQVANADPISSVPPSTDILFKYSDFENLITATQQTLNGVFNVTSIANLTSTAFYFFSGQGGEQLVGRFDGLVTQEITGTNPLEIFFTGGTLTMYVVPNGTFAPNAANTIPAQLCPGGVCPTPFLTANFVPGIVTADSPLGGFDERLTTLHAIFGTGATLANPQGSGFAYLDVTGGTAASILNTNALAGHDLLLRSEFSTIACPGNCGGYAVNSQDPLQGQTSPIPEPASLLLLGSGLAGLAVWYRRRLPNA